MLPWTQQNTEGYTDEQLDRINAVKADLVADGYLNSAADDIITQALHEDFTEESLRAALIKRGYYGATPLSQ